MSIKPKILKSDMKIIDSYLNSFKFNAQSNEVTEKYNKKMNPEFEFLKSNNLIPSLAINIEKWGTGFR